MLKAFLGLTALAVIVVAYKAYTFYQTTVSPVVEGVSQVAALAVGASKVVEKLNPYTVTQESGEIAQKLRDSFGIGVPDGYVGAFGIDVALLGQRQSQVLALIPSGARPADIFEGGRNEIRFNPGSHTIFLAATFVAAEREEMRDAIAKVAGGDGEAEPLQQVYIEAGGRKVAALRGNTQSYGAANTVVFVFFDESQLFFASGPQDNFNEAALQAALAALVASHPANALLYEHPKPELDTPPSSDPCGIPGLKDDFDVYVVSVYKGSTPLDIAIDQSGNDVSQEDVVVGVTPKPVVLILMGYDPIVWNIGQAKDARIAGVLAQGALRQAVIGLPQAVPLTTYSSQDGANACRGFRPQQSSVVDLTVKKRVRELFGRGITAFLTTKPSGPFLVGDVSREVAFSKDRTIESVALPDNVLPGGQKGLDRLVSQQVLRLATEKELNDWITGAAKKSGTDLETYRNKVRWSTRSSHVYVVLKSLELPDGLSGAHARTFIIPAGTAKPSGPQGHNAFLQIEDYQCYGVGCA